MIEQRRLEMLFLWNGIVVFAALFYLGSGFARAAIIAFFIWVSCLLGLGRRWLLRAGFAVSLVAFAVALGCPPPAQWPDLAKKMPTTFSDARAAIFGQPSTTERN